MTNKAQFVKLGDGKIISIEEYPQNARDRLETELEQSKIEISLQDLSSILSSTVKRDIHNKLITFLGMILNYTSEDQVNIAFNSESSTGKSYIPREIARYFPEEDVLEIAYSSPTAFYHELGEWDEEKKIKKINPKINSKNEL
ncbi:MAG: hypothetical protein QGG23_08355 [Candidatus Bathyarchaeota archaeon]|nr:hypothetical protein [Candidatus Bathyarchaeota archaeon]